MYECEECEFYFDVSLNAKKKKKGLVSTVNKKVDLRQVVISVASVAYVPVVAHAIGVGVQARPRVASGVCGRIVAVAVVVHSLGLGLEGIAGA